MILKNRNIIVTGGSKGIGLAISKKIKLEGGNVIIFTRNKNEEIKEFDFFKGDVSNSSSVILFRNYIRDKYNKIDGIVNCAGIYGPIGKTVNVNKDEFINTLNINLMGTINMCSIFSEIFNKKKIVNFSGGGATTPFPNYSAYATSKVSIVRLTENLSLEMPNFDINCVAPGFVATTLHEQTLKSGSEKSGEDFFNKTKEQLKEGSTPPEKAADLTSFLLSDESNGISGKFISAPWDQWQEKEFQDLLRNDKDFAVLRRIDNKQFFRK